MMLTVLITILTTLKKSLHFKDKNNKSKKKCKIYKTLNTILGTVDSNFIIGVTSTFYSFSLDQPPGQIIYKERNVKLF